MSDEEFDLAMSQIYFQLKTDKLNSAEATMAIAEILSDCSEGMKNQLIASAIAVAMKNTFILSDAIGILYEMQGLKRP